MHASALELARRFRDSRVPRAIGPEYAIGEVGARDHNGSLRTVFLDPAYYDGGRLPGYVGFDLAPGPGVDRVVCEEDPRYRVAGLVPWADLMVSCSTLEHSEYPHGVVRRMAEVVKPGGLLWLCAPWSWPEHRHPLDFWRILPDGMASLLLRAGCRVYEVGKNPEGDCWAVGRKP